MEDKFRKWLYNNGLGIVDFAEMMGVTPSIIRYWISGKRRPKAKSMHKIRMLTNWEIKDPEDLYGSIRRYMRRKEF